MTTTQMFQLMSKISTLLDEEQVEEEERKELFRMMIIMSTMTDVIKNMDDVQMANDDTLKRIIGGKDE